MLLVTYTQLTYYISYRSFKSGAKTHNVPRHFNRRKIFTLERIRRRFLALARVPASIGMTELWFPRPNHKLMFPNQL